MGNMRKWLEQTGDEIHCVVVGSFGGYEREDRNDGIPRGVILYWDRPETKAYLDYEFDDGFGSADCHAIYAWSHKYVYFVHEYDGATSLHRVPRNPADCGTLHLNGGHCEGTA